MLGPKRKDVTGGWRRLHNEALHNFYASPNIIKAMKSKKMLLTCYVARVVEMINVYTILAGKPEGKT
jgi:hypothetical protein